MPFFFKTIIFDLYIYIKKSTESCIDVTMGSFDGAEICDLVGLNIQSNLENILPTTNFGYTGMMDSFF